jgi:hypothetical protein
MHNARSIRLDCRIEEAKQRGYLKVFNRRYAQLRQQARRQGAGYMSYTIAVSRLKRELTRCIAGQVDGSVVDRALNATPAATEPRRDQRPREMTHRVPRNGVWVLPEGGPSRKCRAAVESV